MAEQINKINESLYQANIDLVDKNKKLENEIEKLKQRLEIEIDISDGMLKTIDRAIDFLKKNACIDEDVEYFCDDLRYDECKKLLDILKGSENSE